MKQFILTGLVLSCLPAAAFANLIQDAEGTWGTIVINEKGGTVTKEYVCDGLPMHIDVDWETRRLSAYRTDDDRVDADIIKFGDNWLSLKYDGEERVMSNGELHVWVLFMIDEDTFQWVRQDWIVDGRIQSATSTRHRCRPAIS